MDIFSSVFHQCSLLIPHRVRLPQEYVPFGNAYYAIKECAKYQYPDTRFCWANATQANKPGVFDGPLICQHGAGECSANLMEMCVIKYNPDWRA